MIEDQSADTQSVDTQSADVKATRRGTTGQDPWTGWRYPLILVALTVLTIRGVAELVQGDFSWFRVASLLFYIGWAAWLVNKRRHHSPAEDSGA